MWKLPDDGNCAETCSLKLIVKYVIHRIVHLLVLIEFVIQVSSTFQDGLSLRPQVVRSAICYPGADSLYTIKVSKHGAISVGVVVLYFKRDEATGDWRRLHREKPHDLYSPSNVIRVIRSRRMRWAEQVAREGEG